MKAQDSIKPRFIIYQYPNAIYPILNMSKPIKALNVLLKQDETRN